MSYLDAKRREMPSRVLQTAIRSIETMHLEGEDAIADRGLCVRLLKQLLGVIIYDEVQLAEEPPPSALVEQVASDIKAFDAAVKAESIVPPPVTQ